MSEKEIPCKYFGEDGRCLKDQEPGYIGYCVYGPCSIEEPDDESEAGR